MLMESSIKMEAIIKKVTKFEVKKLMDEKGAFSQTQLQMIFCVFYSQHQLKGKQSVAN